jgi:hypothetical protein
VHTRQCIRAREHVSPGILWARTSWRQGFCRGGGREGGGEDPRGAAVQEWEGSHAMLSSYVRGVINFHFGKRHRDQISVSSHLSFFDIGELGLSEVNRLWRARILKKLLLEVLFVVVVVQAC